MRAAVILLVAASLAGCARERRAEPAPGAAPEVVAIKVAPADMARYRVMAKACGAVSTRTETIGDATLLVVGKTDSVAARDCFFAKAHADYRANHPVKAWIEGVIG